MSKLRLNKKGFTLVELLVVICILAVVSATFAVGYSNVIENKRQEADMTKLNNLDLSLNQLLLADDVFEDVSAYIFNDKMLQIRFPVKTDPASGDTYVDMINSTINGDSLKVKDECEILYEYLTDDVGQKVALQSGSYKGGYYEVTIEFNGAKVSEIRDFTPTNDNVKITNTGDEFLYIHKKDKTPATP